MVGKWVVQTVERLGMMSVEKTAAKKALPTVVRMVATRAVAKVVQMA